MLILTVVVLSISAFTYADNCKPSITTASGSAAPKGQICSGSLIFDENFDRLDKGKWQPEVTLWGGGNNEFQWYVADDENSFAKDGKLHVKPTLTADKIGYDQVEHGHVHVDGCTDQDKQHCDRQAGGDVIINPVRSARLRTHNSFSFKYGRVEVIAKIPQGDWLWPAIWLLPTQWKYGGWPRSGEIDLLESRGNVKYGGHNQIGVEQVASTLHFGPVWNHDPYVSSTRNNANGYDKDFHKYEFHWDENGIKFLLDGQEFGYVAAGDGFWKRGGFQGENIWASGTKMAPFDQEFHFIINLAVGGNFFPDVENQNGKRPWDGGPRSMKDFWTNRNQWLPSWQNREVSSLIVDSIKVYAI